MRQYQEKQFDFGSLKGVSKEQIEEHLKLYSGYVNSVNLIEKKTDELIGSDSDNDYVVSELRRRLSFEFNGMRMHEYYFEQFENGAKKLNPQSRLAKVFHEECGGLGSFIDKFKTTSLTRGIGWAAFCYDRKSKIPHIVWVDGHDIGLLCGLSVILIIDMWEHAYMVDYKPSEKKEHINNFFENINWEVVENRFDKVISEA